MVAVLHSSKFIPVFEKAKFIITFSVILMTAQKKKRKEKRKPDDKRLSDATKHASSLAVITRSRLYLVPSSPLPLLLDTTCIILFAKSINSGKSSKRKM